MDYTKEQISQAQNYLKENNISSSVEARIGLKNNFGIDADALNAQIARWSTTQSTPAVTTNVTPTPSPSPTAAPKAVNTPTVAPKTVEAPTPTPKTTNEPSLPNNPEPRPTAAPTPRTVDTPTPNITQSPSQNNQISQVNNSINTIDDFKKAWWTTSELTKLLENRGIENIEIKWNRVYWESAWERFEWTIDSENNPSKRSLWAIANEKEQFAKDMWISFSVNDEWQTVFKPWDIDEAIDLYSRFWPNARISVWSKEAIKWSAVFQKYSKYTWATSDTFLDGLRSHEIAVGWDTWDRIVKMNGGEITPEMAEARDRYNSEMQVASINSSNKSIYDTLSNSTSVSSVSKEKELEELITKLDTDYISSKKDLFSEMESLYATFKEGAEATNELRKKANDTASEIDKIETAKRNVLKDIQSENPRLPLSAQITLAQRATSDLDDAIYTLQRQYNIEIADYQYADTQDKAEFEFNMNMISVKDSMMSEIYGIQRSDISQQKSEAREDRLLSEQIQRENIIRQEEIERADRLIQQNIEREDFLYQQAIDREDYLLAEEKAYNKLLLEEQKKMNDSAYQFLTPWEGLIAVANPNTWEIEFQSVPGSSTSSSWSGTVWVSSWEDISTLWTGVDFIKRWEWFRNEAYQDVAWVWTIWFWFTTLNWRSVKQWDTISRAEATNMLQENIDRHSAWKWKISIDLTEEQETALSSFEYNLWSGIWNYSNTWAGPIIDMVNQWDFEWAANLMKKFNRAWWEFVQWLQNRRNQEADLLMTTSSISNSEDDVPLARDALIFNIGKSIFGSKISDAEWAKVKTFVDKGMAEWLDTDQIIDKILFFEPTDNVDLGQWLKSVLISNNVDLSEFDMRRLGKLLSDWDLSSAIAKTENAIYWEARSNDPDWFISETLIKTTARRSVELSEKIAALQNTTEWKKNPLWTFNGSVENWLWRFKSAEATQLKNDATRLVSQFRLENLWSAVTPAEEKFLDGILPKISDSASNFAIKVDSFWDQALWELNDFRNTLELPNISYDALLDKSLRSSWYIWSTPTQVTTQDDIVNSWLWWWNSSPATTNATGSYLDWLWY